MTKTARMLAVMRSLGIEVPIDARITRTYAGSAQRSCGAWSWSTHSPSNPTFEAGSQWPISLLLVAPKLVHSSNSYGQISIDPDPWPKTVRFNGNLKFVFSETLSSTDSKGSPDANKQG